MKKLEAATAEVRRRDERCTLPPTCIARRTCTSPPLPLQCSYHTLGAHAGHSDHSSSLSTIKFCTITGSTQEVRLTSTEPNKHRGMQSTECCALPASPHPSCTFYSRVSGQMSAEEPAFGKFDLRPQTGCALTCACEVCQEVDGNGIDDRFHRALWQLHQHHATHVGPGREEVVVPMLVEHPAA